MSFLQNLLKWRVPRVATDPDTGDIEGMVGPDGQLVIVISADAPSDADGRADGTIYIQTAT